MKRTVRAGGGISRRPAAPMAVAAFFGAPRAATARQAAPAARFGAVVAAAACGSLSL